MALEIKQVKSPDLGPNAQRFLVREKDVDRVLGSARITKQGSEYFVRVKSGKFARFVELGPTDTVGEAKKRIKRFFNPRAVIARRMGERERR